MKLLSRLTIIVNCLCGLSAPSFSAVHIATPAQNTMQIWRVINEAAFNDTLLFKPGHYLINNLTIRKPLCLLGENYPVLDGSFRYQVLLIASSHVTVKGFRIINVGISDLEELSGIHIQNASHVTIADNWLEDVFFGVYCSNSSSCLVNGNHISSRGERELQSGNGIHCWKCDSMTITSNDLKGQRDGIYFEFVTNSVIRQNVSHGNIRYGLHFMFSHNNLYEFNTFSGNGAGVAVMYSHQVTMNKNTFEKNLGESSYGILMKDISDSHVNGNFFISNTIGIYMEGTSRIQVEYNTFASNGWAFRLQSSCSDIVITRNKFIGNTFDVATNGSLVLNRFENNFWDKYDGYDMNKDGVGDIPYRPVSLFSVISERMPYSIMLFRSFMVMLLEQTEKALPVLTPVDMKDDKPLMKPFSL